MSGIQIGSKIRNLRIKNGLTQGEITSVFQYNYPIFTDDFMFRVNPGKFDELRQKYRYRRELFI